MPEQPDATAVDADAYPWALVDLDGHVIDRYPTEALAKLYRWEQSAGTCVVYAPKPRELSRRTDLQ